MTDNAPAREAQENTRQKNPNQNIIITLLLIALVIYFIFQNPQMFWNILIVMLGFSAVVFIHELGHFIAAKSVGIFVEEFSIGMGTIVLGLKKVAGGLRIRVLPNLLVKHDGSSMATFVIPTGGRQNGETEYQLRLIPLGGFVKMMGQEDLGPDKPTDDPRSFANKPFLPRALTISAGVIMNIVSAAIAFIIVFMIGISLQPAIVGDVLPGSPAAQAGLEPGDQIISINGKEENLDFTNLSIAGAFTEEGQAVSLVVKSPAGRTKELSVEPEFDKDIGIRRFGIAPPTSLTIAQPQEKEMLAALKETGLKPGDTIVAVNGNPIDHGHQLKPYLRPSVGHTDLSPIQLSVKRQTEEGQTQITSVTLPTELYIAGKSAGSLLGMVPRLKIIEVIEDSPAEKAGLQEGDVITKVESIKNPTREELTDVFQKKAGKPVSLTVRRKVNDEWTAEALTVTPKVQKNWWQFFSDVPATVGVLIPAMALEEPIVVTCKPYTDDKEELLPLPRGAEIKSIDGEAVSNWHDMLVLLLKARGREAEIGYSANDNPSVQTVTTTIPDTTNWVGFAPRPVINDLPSLPLKPLEHTYKADSVGAALGMGLDRTYTIIANTYLTIRGMVTGTVSAKSASGPVGILKMSYTIVDEKPVTYYIYFMALISVAIAVFNFLPLPILDGGLIVMLIIEKIKGSPLSLRTQEILNYAGLALIAGLFLFITYNDILKVATGQL